MLLHCFKDTKVIFRRRSILSLGTQKKAKMLISGDFHIKMFQDAVKTLNDLRGKSS